MSVRACRGGWGDGARTASVLSNPGTSSHISFTTSSMFSSVISTSPRYSPCHVGSEHPAWVGWVRQLLKCAPRP